MRIVFAGPLPTSSPKEGVVERGDDGAHGGCSMGPEFVAELNRLGYDAELWNFWHTVEEGALVEDAYDAVFFFDNNMYELWKRVVPNWDWKRKLSIAWMHLVNLEPGQSAEICERCQIVGMTSPQLAAEHQELALPGQPIILPWATTTRNLTCMMSPYRHVEALPVLLWCGRIGERAAHLLHNIFNELAVDLQLHVISATCNEQKTSWPDNYVEFPRAAHWHGPMKHGTFDHYLDYATLALDASLGPDQRVINCKHYDYLGAGLPMVCEPVPSFEIMQSLGHGIVVPFERNNWRAYVEAIRKALTIDWDRDRVRAYMQEHHTWTQRARQVHEQIKTLGWSPS